MRRFLAVLTSAFLGLAVGGTLPASAASADTLNGQASGSLSVIDFINSPLCPPNPDSTETYAQEMPYRAASGGTGTLRLGICDHRYKSTTYIDQYTTRYTYNDLGAFEIVTPGGDTVRGGVAGVSTTLIGVSKPYYTYDLTLTPTSGTGQFRGATGTIKLVGDYSYGGGPGHAGGISGSLTGSLAPAPK